MVNKPSTVDEALAYVWALPDTALRLSEKQSIAAALAEKADAVARRYFSSPDPEHWVGTLKELLKPAGILPSSEAFGYFWHTHFSCPEGHENTSWRCVCICSSILRMLLECCYAA